MRRLAGLVATLGALALPALAAAQDPRTPPVTTPPPAATPPPAEGAMTLKLERVRGRPAFALAGRRWRVRGFVSVFVPGQQVTVRLYLGRHRMREVSIAILPGPKGTGRFVVGFSTRRTGRYTVQASHVATPQQVTFVAPPRRLT